MTPQDEKEALNIINELSSLLSKIGWSIAVPDQDAVDHLIIGKTETLKRLANQLDSEGVYDIMVRESN